MHSVGRSPPKRPTTAAYAMTPEAMNADAAATDLLDAIDMNGAEQKLGPEPAACGPSSAATAAAHGDMLISLQKGGSP